MEPMVDGFSLSLGNIPSEMCSNQVVRAYLEKKDLEYRGEIWDWGEGEVLRTYFAKVGTKEGGATWDNDDWRIGQFRQKWETPEEIDDKILKYPRIYEEDQRRAERISRIVSSENSLDKFALSFRLRGLNLGFRMDGRVTCRAAFRRGRPRRSPHPDGFPLLIDHPHTEHRSRA